MNRTLGAPAGGIGPAAIRAEASQSAPTMIAATTGTAPSERGDGPTSPPPPVDPGPLKAGHRPHRDHQPPGATRPRNRSAARPGARAAGWQRSGVGGTRASATIGAIAAPSPPGSGQRPGTTVGWQAAPPTRNVACIRYIWPGPRAFLRNTLVPTSIQPATRPSQADSRTRSDALVGDARPAPASGPRDPRDSSLPLQWPCVFLPAAGSLERGAGRKPERGRKPSRT